MSRLLVIGRTGQLARSLAERASAQGLAPVFLGRPETDLLRPDSLRAAINRAAPRIIINAAAYTAVDQAEDEVEQARLINAVAPIALAEAAAETDARLIHVSTDYVFDGSGDRAWREDDPPAPTGVYGQTKLEGEEGVRAALADHVIVRTAWVYSPFGRNFVKTMLQAAESRPQLRVVKDQIGNPTSALDLADGLLAMVKAWESEPRRGVGATYHLAGGGEASWADFAREIFALSRARGGPSADVTAITSSEWPAKAARPLDSRLDSDRFAETFGFRAPPWRDSLERVVERLLAS